MSEHVEIVGLDAVLARLTALPMAVNTTTRAAGLAAGRLADAAYRSAAAGARAPQTKRFSDAISADTSSAGVVVSVDAGAGDFANPGAVFNATEFGSHLERFHAPPTASGYWIAPTTERIATPITDLYRAAVHAAVEAG